MNGEICQIALNGRHAMWLRLPPWINRLHFLNLVEGLEDLGKAGQQDGQVMRVKGQRGPEPENKLLVKKILTAN